MVESFLNAQERELSATQKTSWTFKLFHQRGEGLHPGAPHLFGIVVGPGGNPTLTKGKKTITCCTDNFVLLVAVTQQKVTPSFRHDAAVGNPVPETGYQVQIAGIFL